MQKTKADLKGYTTLGTKVGYEDEYLRVEIDDVVFPNGKMGTYARVAVGEGYGVVSVPVTRFRGNTYVGLVEQERYPIGKKTIEFPRGGGTDTGISETSRELFEETGLTPTSSQRLGSFYADTGILVNEIAVWLTHHNVNPHESSHVETETGATLRWVSLGQLKGRISSGKLSCGITLAAWALVLSSDVLHPDASN